MIPESNELRFEVTTKCNYNCVICPREKLTRKKETMSLETFKFLFDKIRRETDQYDTAAFPGMGEPLMDPTLDGKVAYAKEAGFTTLLLTNGSLLDVDRFRSLERSGLDSIRVSFYGNTANTYNRIHGIGNGNFFERIRGNLAEIFKLRKKTEILLTYNALDSVNHDEVGSWIDYWKDKADLLEVWRPHNWVDGRSYREVRTDQLATCGRPFKTPLQIQVDGTVNMCCFDFNGQLLLGDLKTRSLAEIFDAPAYRRIAACHTTGDYGGSGLICESCDQRNKDKSDVMIYNSRYKIEDRVHQLSTTYQKIEVDDGKPAPARGTRA